MWLPGTARLNSELAEPGLQQAGFLPHHSCILLTLWAVADPAEVGTATFPLVSLMPFSVGCPSLATLSQAFSFPLQCFGF